MRTGWVRTAWRVVMGVCIAATTAACGTLPDVKPFAEATLTLERTSAAAFEASARTQDRVAAMITVPGNHEEHADLDPKRKRYADLAARLRTEAEHRAALYRACTDYADALAAIVDASENAQGNVQALSDSVMKLVAVFQASPLPAVAAGAVELGQIALRELIRIKASRDLRLGLESADPVIRHAAMLMERDAAALASTLDLKADAIDTYAEQVGGQPYLDEMRRLERLEARRAAMLAAIAALAPGAAVESDASSTTLERIDGQRASSKAALAAATRERDEVKRAYAEAVEVLRAHRSAVAAWGTAHGDLTTAAREGGGVNVRRLVEVTMEVKAVVDRMNKAKE